AGSGMLIATLMEIENGGTGGQWMRSQFEIKFADVTQLGIKAEVFEEWQGTMAVDDISFNNKPCTADPEVNGTLFCDFEESDMCGFHSHESHDTTSWTWSSSGKPPFDNTLHTGQGHKMSIDPNQVGPSKIARLVSPYIAPLDDFFCASFWFWLDSHDTANITGFYFQDGEYSVDLLSRSGNHGYLWNGASLSGELKSNKLFQ
ncbi:unnamed protein product, partial [Meganyctiphanes norvegica]